MTAKKRQHHVWQHYLEPWCSAGKLHCLRDGNLYQTGTVSVAVEGYFYKLSPLTNVDLKLVHWLLVEKASPRTRQLHEEFLISLAAPSRFVSENRDKLRNIVSLEKHLREHQINVLEDHHSKIEQMFEPLLGRILSRDTAFYEDGNDAMTFLHYLGTQYMRTKGVKERVVKKLRESSDIDVSRVWDVMAIISGFNVASSLFFERKRRRLYLLENNTSHEFITGDQPAINLLNDDDPPTELSIYYPVSPELALILSAPDQEPMFQTESLTTADVAMLNIRIFKASYSEVYGRSEVALEPLHRLSAATRLVL